jgi:hypothetical protein
LTSHANINSGAECRFYHEGADEVQALTGPSPAPHVLAAQQAAAAAAASAASLVHALTSDNGIGTDMKIKSGNDGWSTSTAPMYVVFCDISSCVYGMYRN